MPELTDAEVRAIEFNYSFNAVIVRLCEMIRRDRAEKAKMAARIEELEDGIRHGADMAINLWERLGEDGTFADHASQIKAHLLGTIIGETTLAAVPSKGE